MQPLAHRPYLRAVLEAPRDTPDDLAERYRQLRDFDEAETVLVSALLKRPDRLARSHEITLRQALNLARLWVVQEDEGGPEFVVGHLIGPLRDRARLLAKALVRSGDGLDPASLGADAEALRPQLVEARAQIISRHGGHLLPSALDREVGQKSLVLVLGGGGGCGYVHLGAFSLLASLGIVPKLVVGSSMGSILGLFRAREANYRDATVRAVTHGLTFKKLFRIFESEAKYGLPGTLRLYLRSALSRFFVSGRGETTRIGELPIPFTCVVTGIRRESLRRDIRDYERAFERVLRRGAMGALLHVKDIVTSWTALITELIQTPGGVRAIPLGADPHTREFDVLDAVGFSCAVPALIHYDILREDPRMHELMQSTLQRFGVDTLVDGGVSANVPTRFAWESVQRGRVATRNAFILGLDCFAPQIGRNLLYMPLMRIAAENVARDRPFAQQIYTYRRVLSPAALVPNERHVQHAINSGRLELEALGPFIQKMLEPLPRL